MVVDFVIIRVDFFLLVGCFWLFWWGCEVVVIVWIEWEGVIGLFWLIFGVRILGGDGVWGRWVVVDDWLELVEVGIGIISWDGIVVGWL